MRYGLPEIVAFSVSIAAKHSQNKVAGQALR
jgi:hypothetical protein